jgi:hypothetical protein
MTLFAAAVLIATVLFADRLGSDAELKRRFYQVGLALATALFVIAAAAALTPGSEGSGEALDFGQLQESGGVLRERVSIVVGAGLLVFIAGLYQSSSYRTISVGMMLAGLLLLLAASDIPGGLLQSYYELELEGGQARNTVYAAVTGVGLALLIAYGLREWDRPAAGETAEADSLTG